MRSTLLLALFLSCAIIPAAAQDKANATNATGAPVTALIGAAEPGPHVNVALSETDVRVSIIAIANAGQACDQNVQAICQVVAARAGTLAKLQEALQQLAKQSEAAAPKAPAAKH